MGTCQFQLNCHWERICRARIALLAKTRDGARERKEANTEGVGNLPGDKKDRGLSPCSVWIRPCGLSQC